MKNFIYEGCIYNTASMINIALFFLCIFFLIAFLRERKKRKTDQLTGLKNKIAMERKYKKRKKFKSLTVAYIDLNNFKNINDTYGHEAGDYIIKQIAFFLESHTRPSDDVFRLHGDEFLIILKGANRESAEIKIKNLQKGLEMQSFLYKGVRINTTFSVGIIHEGKTTVDIFDMLEKADLLMLKNKKDQKKKKSIREKILALKKKKRK